MTVDFVYFIAVVQNKAHYRLLHKTNQNFYLCTVNYNHRSLNGHNYAHVVIYIQSHFSTETLSVIWSHV